MQASGYQTPGSGRARRDAAARAMQGWHAQRLLAYGEVAEPIIKVFWNFKSNYLFKLVHVSYFYQVINSSHQCLQFVNFSLNRTRA